MSSRKYDINEAYLQALQEMQLDEARSHKEDNEKAAPRTVKNALGNDIKTREMVEENRLTKNKSDFEQLKQQFKDMLLDGATTQDIINFYKKHISSYFSTKGIHCKFEPTCSEYMKQAINLCIIRQNKYSISEENLQGKHIVFFLTR